MVDLVDVLVVVDLVQEELEGLLVVLVQQLGRRLEVEAEQQVEQAHAAGHDRRESEHGSP